MEDSQMGSNCTLLELKVVFLTLALYDWAF